MTVKSLGLVGGYQGAAQCRKGRRITGGENDTAIAAGASNAAVAEPATGILQDRHGPRRSRRSRIGCSNGFLLGAARIIRTRSVLPLGAAM